MSRPQAPSPAKLVISLFLKARPLLSEVVGQLVGAFGPPDVVSPWLPFDFTRYYAAEFGSPLYRRMLAFKELIAQERLATIKASTNTMEARFSLAGRRRVNIDPGYLLRERFVLASAKNFAHRIYIGGGIYADLTLVYRKGVFQPLAWTYVDYMQDDMLAYLKRVRRKYVADLKASARLPHRKTEVRNR